MDSFALDQTEPGVVKVRGELDLVAGRTLLASLAPAPTGGFDIDLSGVTFLDSSGLRTMLQIRREHHEARFVRPSPIVARVIEVTGLGKILGIDEEP